MVSKFNGSNGTLCGPWNLEIHAGYIYQARLIMLPCKNSWRKWTGWPNSGVNHTHRSRSFGSLAHFTFMRCIVFNWKKKCTQLKFTLKVSLSQWKKILERSIRKNWKLRRIFCCSHEEKVKSFFFWYFKTKKMYHIHIYLCDIY